MKAHSIRGGLKTVSVFSWKPHYIHFLYTLTLQQHKQNFGIFLGFLTLKTLVLRVYYDYILWLYIMIIYNDFLLYFPENRFKNHSSCSFEILKIESKWYVILCICQMHNHFHRWAIQESASIHPNLKWPIKS